MIRRYFQRLYDAIPFSIDSVRTRADWRAWRRRTRRALRICLGLEAYPPRTPLRPRAVGALRREGCVLERVVFETRPGFLMTANLYRPEVVRGRRPGVLCVHGHGMDGKLMPELQFVGMNCARAGGVMLAVDATGHGERVHIGHRGQIAITTSGLALEGIQVWDNMRALDYLASRPEVDPWRLGITGCSGGGNQTMYTAALDERLKAAVPVCSVSTLRGQIFTNNSIGCDCECVPDLMRWGLENAVVCGLIAPRALLILAGTKEEVFPIQHTRVAHRHLRRFWRAIGCGDRYGYEERPLPHGYHPAFRELAHAWLARWLGGMSPEYSEAGLTLEPKENIWCFPDGRLPGESGTLGTLALARGRELVRRLHIPRAEAGRRALRRAIRQKVLGGFPPRGALKAKESRPTMGGGALRWTVELTSEPGMTIRADIARPAGGADPCPCVIRLRPQNEPGPWPRAAEFLRRGLAVAELAVRPLEGDEHASKAALVLGRPMVGMGAYDLTRFVDYLARRRDFAREGVSLWAEGLMTLPALFAFALDERLAAATLVGLHRTYLSPVPVPHPTWTYARGLLKYADIDHLLALGAPRPLTVAAPVGADLRPLSPAALPKAFPAARRAYGRGGAFRVSAECPTDERSLRKA